MARTIPMLRMQTCIWRGKKQKYNYSRRTMGQAHVCVIVIICVVFSSILYLFAINGSAVKGHTMKQIEREIATLRVEQEQLRIQETDLMSLQNIKGQSEYLRMHALKDVTYIRSDGPLARRQ